MNNATPVTHPVPRFVREYLCEPCNRLSPEEEALLCAIDERNRAPRQLCLSVGMTDHGLWPEKYLPALVDTQ